MLRTRAGNFQLCKKVAKSKNSARGQFRKWGNVDSSNTKKYSYYKEKEKNCQKVHNTCHWLKIIMISMLKRVGN